jgi:1,4-alpha-glucan branching enzyme
MRAVRDGRLWTVTIPLAAGRHRYAFLVNGARWLADPSAPRAQDDFGAPSSVVTVGG